MAAEAPALTHCPNCGAALKRPDLSLCAYCAMPLMMGGRASVADDETTARLKRMREHANFPAAQAFVPPDPEVERVVAKKRNRGLLLVIFGALWLAVALLVQFLGSGIDLRSPWLWVGDGVALLGILSIVTAAGARAAASGGKPLLVRPAIVAERRSETNPEGRYGARTLYFFTLRFDDTSEGEFKWPGQGLSSEPMANGQVGIAYTRGEDLIAFRKLG
ncbi:MAG: hypothetical protein IPJ19_03870 [Planctomycetes bacterium]|nr:hypothetical protein [Planctomycetota bacterium]